MNVMQIVARLFLFLTLFLVGCGTFQVAVDESPAPAGATTTITRPAEATATTATRELVTERASQPAPTRSPAGDEGLNGVFYDAHTGFLLGGVSAGGWVSPTAIVPAVEDGRRYQLYAGGSRIAQVVGTVEQVESPICAGYTLDLVQEPAAAWAVAVGGATWDVTPFPPVAVTLRNEQQAALEALLRARGLQIEPGSLAASQVLRVDLEGDGDVELVVAASRLDGNGRMPPVAANDYALVAVIRADNDVEPVILDLYPQAETLAYPWRYEVAAILDLNGDGRQELVVAATRYEGRRTVVYELDGTSPFSPVLEAGCGPEQVAAAPPASPTPSPRVVPTVLPTPVVTDSPTRVPTPDAHIAEFSVEPRTATPGDTVTVSWEATGISAELCLQVVTVGQQVATRGCEEVPLSGSQPYPLDPIYRNKVLLALEVRNDGEVANASLPVDLPCPDDWWFMKSPPDVCPATDPFRSAAAAEYFERGHMIWLGETDTFYVFFAEGSTYRTFHGPLPTSGATPEPAEPPDGYYAPVSGFGLLWYGLVPGSDELRERLGWARGPEVGYEAVWQVEARPEQARTFLQGPNGEVYLLHDGLNRWEHWIEGG